VLGIGTPELLVIGLIIVIFYGPDRLPELLSKVTRFVSDIRGLGQNARQQFQREMIKVENQVKQIQEPLDTKEQTETEQAPEALSTSIKTDDDSNT